MFGGLNRTFRIVFFAAAMLLLFPGEPLALGPVSIPPFNTAGALVLAVAASIVLARTASWLVAWSGRSGA